MTVFFWHASKLPPSLALTSSPYKLSRVYLMEFVWGSENGKGVKSTPLCSQINSFKDKAEIAWYSKIRQGKQRSSGKIGLLGHSQPVRPNLARHHGWAVVATSGHNPLLSNAALWGVALNSSFYLSQHLRPIGPLLPALLNSFGLKSIPFLLTLGSLSVNLW